MQTDEEDDLPAAKDYSPEADPAVDCGTGQRLADIDLKVAPITFRMFLALAVMEKTDCSWSDAMDAARYAAAGHPEWPVEERRTVLDWMIFRETKPNTESNGEPA